MTTIDNIIKFVNTYPHICKNKNEFLKSLDKLNSMIGLENIKSTIYDQIKYYLLKKKGDLNHFRKNDPDKNEKYPHSIFMGPSGVGKTTVAEILISIWRHIDIITDFPNNKIDILSNNKKRKRFDFENTYNYNYDDNIIINNNTNNNENNQNDFGSFFFKKQKMDENNNIIKINNPKDNLKSDYNFNIIYDNKNNDIINDDNIKENKRKKRKRKRNKNKLENIQDNNLKNDSNYLNTKEKLSKNNKKNNDNNNIIDNCNNITNTTNSNNESNTIKWINYHEEFINNGFNSFRNMGDSYKGNNNNTNHNTNNIVITNDNENDKIIKNNDKGKFILPKSLKIRNDIDNNINNLRKKFQYPFIDIFYFNDHLNCLPSINNSNNNINNVCKNYYISGDGNCINKLGDFNKFIDINDNRENIFSNAKNIFFDNFKDIDSILSDFDNEEENNYNKNKDNYIFASRSDIIGQYIGHTAKKVKTLFENYQYIFIDEAYSLAQGSKNDFGREALTEITNILTNWKGVLILSGYSDKMKELLELNEGLSSRFSWHFNFKPYEPLDLYNIFLKQCHENGFNVDKSLSSTWFENRKDFFNGNGRYIGNLIRQCELLMIDKLWENALMDNNKSNNNNNGYAIISLNILDKAFENLKKLSDNQEDKKVVLEYLYA